MGKVRTYMLSGNDHNSGLLSAIKFDIDGNVLTVSRKIDGGGWKVVDKPVDTKYRVSAIRVYSDVTEIDAVSIEGPQTITIDNKD